MMIPWPVPAIYQITSDEADHALRGEGDAVDFAAPAGVPWLACFDGTITVNQHDPGAGWMVYLQTDGFRARFCHGDKAGPLPVGTEVNAGDIIGWVGDIRTGQTGGATTGNHLHFVLEQRGANGAWLRLRPSEWLDYPGSLPNPSDNSQGGNMISIKAALDIAWAKLSELQAHPDATPAIVALAEELKQSAVVAIKEAVGLA